MGSLAHLTQVGENKGSEYEKRLFRLAAEANKVSVGIFDNPSGRLKHMPADLQEVRHYRLDGRHRVYVTGSHKNCTYTLWLIKEFKDTGKLSEGDTKFKDMLRSAMQNPNNYLLDMTDDAPSYPELQSRGDAGQPNGVAVEEERQVESD